MRISILMEKGGAGKTTFCANLATLWAQNGTKTLIIDLDPQGHLARILGVTYSGRRTILDLIVRGGDIRDFVVPTRIGGLSIIPSDWSLADLTVNIANDPTRHLKLRTLLDGVADYELAILDTPPSLELITVNILLASDSVIIPVPLTYLGLVGCANTLKVISNAKKAFGYAPKILAVVPNIHDGSSLCEEFLSLLRRKLGEFVSETVIPKDPEVDRAQSFTLTVVELAPDSPGAKNFRKLHAELLSKI